MEQNIEQNMDQSVEQNTEATATHIQFPTKDATARSYRKDILFHRRDWLACFAMLILAGAYVFLHDGLFSWDFRGLPGIGLTLSVWGMLIVCVAHRERAQIKWTRQNIFLLGATLLLAATYGVFDHQTLRLMNLPVLLILFILTLYSLDGSISIDAYGAVGKSIARSIRNITHYLLYPIYALWNCVKGTSGKRLKELLLGLLICIPVIGILLLLLGNADSVFGDMVLQLQKSFHFPNVASFIWKIIYTLVLTLIAFALVYGASHAISRDQKARDTHSLPEISLLTLLTAICMLYAVFVYVQIRFLFGGKTLMGSEYADYARNGFFELVAVACLTLLIVLPALRKHSQNIWVRMECGIVTLLTMVIVFSACWRMGLYISEFGFTFLRAVTLWGILAITAAMIATLVKASCPRLSIFKPLLLFTICTWLIFNFCNINARIAEFNVSAYRSGAIEALDVYYLRTLGVDALPTIDALIEEPTLPADTKKKVITIRKEIISDSPSAYDWSLSWLKVK